jgi:hypothetical protein
MSSQTIKAPEVEMNKVEVIGDEGVFINGRKVDGVTRVSIVASGEMGRFSRVSLELYADEITISPANIEINQLPGSVS